MALVKLLDKKKVNEWDNFVLSHEEGSIYHTSKWRDIIKRTYGHHPLYIVVIGQQGNIIGGMPIFLVKGILTTNRICSVLCAQACNPLFGTQSDYENSLEYLKGLVKKHRCKYAEIRTTGEGKLKTNVLETKTQKFSTHILKLNRRVDVIRNSFHKSCIQRSIQKSYKSGLKLVKASTETDIREFYRLYASMRKGHGLLPQPLKFFSAMWKELHDSGHMEINYAKCGDRVTSSILLLKYKGRVTYEYGASDPEMLRFRPSHFLLWEAIKEAVMDGYEEFDFGRTSKDNVSLSKFKSRWGTQQETLTYYLLYNEAGVKPIRESKTAREMMQVVISKAPLWFCKFAGGVLYKHLV